MNLPIKRLLEIVESELPAPGSINFQNCVPEIKVPLFQNVGFVSYCGDDPAGIGPGKAEVVRKLVGELVFRKEPGKDGGWQLVIDNDELKSELLIQKETNHQQHLILKFAVHFFESEGKTKEEIRSILSGDNVDKKRKSKKRS